MAYFKQYHLIWCALNRSSMEANEDLIIISVLQNLVSISEYHHRCGLQYDVYATQ